jgi:hypothetical protein
MWHSVELQSIERSKADHENYDDNKTIPSFFKLLKKEGTKLKVSKSNADTHSQIFAYAFIAHNV